MSKVLPWKASEEPSSSSSNFNLIEFYEELGQKYPEEKLSYLSLSAKLRTRFIVSWLQSLDGNLLDVGCNVGTFCGMRDDFVFGVDVSESVLVRAKQNVPTAAFFVGDARSLPAVDEVIDNILLTEVLEHIPDPVDVLAECHRLLQPGGKLLVTVPNFRGMVRPTWTIKEKMKEYGVEPRPYLHTAYKPEELQTMVEHVGLRVAELGTFGQEVVLVRRITRYFRSLNRRLLRLGVISDLTMRRIIGFTERLVYLVLKSVRLDSVIRRHIQEGNCSYIIATK